MFDTYLRQERGNSIPYEKTVHEHRAPLDETVKLLNEMQNAALKNIIKTIRVEDNTLNAVVVYMIQQACYNKLSYIVKFKFNGKEHELRGEIERRKLMDTVRYGSQTVAYVLAKAICLLFAETVIKEAPGLSDQLRQIF